ncbi:hypothetical protein HJ059_18590 [Vibrio parahaemolyticus]|nr:hypothetical protein [Vibrio parahaemolyticus]MDF4994589.1 hypothetical protein [Vibrio parahaemolyticus]HCH1607410.1 hypothetical protein [Vibrio parahaemolyticus]HCM0850427.1 hypothetical protein [Vibrio parahaemolyticus]
MRQLELPLEPFVSKLHVPDSNVLQSFIEHLDNINVRYVVTRDNVLLEARTELINSIYSVVIEHEDVHTLPVSESDKDMLYANA